MRRSFGPAECEVDKSGRMFLEKKISKNKSCLECFYSSLITHYLSKRRFSQRKVRPNDAVVAWARVVYEMSRLQPASSLMLMMTKILHGTTSVQGLIRRLVREGGSQRCAVRCRRWTDCKCQATAMVKRHCRISHYCCRPCHSSAAVVLVLGRR